jgi:hypothetical protein
MKFSLFIQTSFKYLNLASFSQEPVAAYTRNVRPPAGIIVSCCAYNFITSYPQGHGIIQTIAVTICPLLSMLFHL